MGGLQRGTERVGHMGVSFTCSEGGLVGPCSHTTVLFEMGSVALDFKHC